MISDLQEIVEHRIRGVLNLTALRGHFDGQPLDTPARSLAFATSYCQAALPCLATDPDASVAAQGADLLIQFLAFLPQELSQSINQIKEFAPPSSRAWQDPAMDRYVGLCCVVHDVWAHLFGPESKDDIEVLRRLLESPARRAIDFGAGTGHFAHQLALHGTAVDAVEPDVVKRAFLAFRAQRTGLAHLIGIGPRPVDYDLGLAIDVLDHMEHPAEAIDQLATYLSPGARLLVLAAFPNDGWHQSDEGAIALCGEALWRYFVPDGIRTSGAAWLEVFLRRTGCEPVRGSRVPKLHGGVRWHSTETDEVVMSVDSRFCRPCILNHETAEICDQLRGDEPVASLANRNGVEVEELSALCDSLRDQRVLIWLPEAF